MESFMEEETPEEETPEEETPEEETPEEETPEEETPEEEAPEEETPEPEFSMESFMEESAPESALSMESFMEESTPESELSTESSMDSPVEGATMESFMEGLMEEPTEDPSTESLMETPMDQPIKEEFSWDDSFSSSDTSDFDVLQLEEVSMELPGTSSKKSNSSDVPASKSAAVHSAIPEETLDPFDFSSSKKSSTSKAFSEFDLGNESISTTDGDTADHIRNIVQTAEKSWNETNPKKTPRKR
jgi:hypothetical protein